MLIWIGKKSFYNMSYFVLLSDFSLFGKTEDNVDKLMKNSKYNWGQWSLCNFFTDCKYYVYYISGKLFCLYFMMFLDA